MPSQAFIEKREPFTSSVFVALLVDVVVPLGPPTTVVEVESAETVAETV